MYRQTGKYNSESSNGILTSVQLGWLVIEAFGRLRMYQRSKRKPVRLKGDQTRRFVFSTNEPKSLDELRWTIRQLHYRVVKLNLDIPPSPLPAEQDLEKKLKEGLDLDALQEKLDSWSKMVWCLLNVENEVMGRAFVYGGSLADTYWHALPWSENLAKDLLQQQRLSKIAERFARISGNLPPYTVPAICNSLDEWSKVKFDLIKDDKLKYSLEVQQKVWRNLLFGGRSAESYIEKKDWRKISLLSTSVRVALVLCIVILLTIAGWGLGSIFPSNGSTNSLSGFFAAVSSLIVVVVGLVKHFSSWVKQIGDFVRERQKQKFINRRTYKTWRKPVNTG